METDKTTLADLSVFHVEEEFSIFQKINFTRTTKGKQQLKKNLSTTLNTLEEIADIQDTIKRVETESERWPQHISNGTLMVVEQFFESVIDPIPANPTNLSALSYRYLHAPDFSLIKYSAGHCFDFIKGMKSFILLFGDDNPKPLQSLLTAAKIFLDHPSLKNITEKTTFENYTISEILALAYFLRYKFKNQTLHLISMYAQLDAWYSMAKCKKHFQLNFPDFTDSEKPFLEVEGLYHILLENPVSYELELNEKSNFIFLTGANMAGKSTFIKSIGAAVYLAHIGMPVPAKKMKLGMFDGLLSNINVMDNLTKGESYFYNEVQRIKATINRINNGKKWLILIDELFKGTNVQDAMKCSIAVVEGFIKMHNSIFILSTHLYEISESLTQYENISFHFFETSIENDQLQFNYQLKPGISNDRIGYLILKQEGVVKMLNDL